MPAAIVSPGKTTASNAAVAAKENEEKAKAAEAARKREKAKLKPRKEAPLTVRSVKFDLRDPDTGEHLPAGKLVTLPYAGGWLRSQVKNDLIEVVDGDINAPVEEPDPETNKVLEEPKQEAGESDEAFKARMDAYKEAKANETK